MVCRRCKTVKHNLSEEQFARLAVVEIPDGVLGNIHQFKNFDPSRIVHYELKEDSLLLYMEEVKRLEAMLEFRSTIEAFRYEVERGVRPEVEVFSSFEYTEDFSVLTFTVDRTEYEQDITAEMIELSITEDAIKYQIYNRKPIGVEVRYKDVTTNQVFEQRTYPEPR